MIWAMILVPALAGGLALAVRGDRLRGWLLMGAAWGHAALVAGAWAVPPRACLGGWFAVGPLELLMLSITSVLFLAGAFYAGGYLRREGAGPRADIEEGFLFRNERQSIFVGCMLLFLSTMTMVIVSRHFGLLWVAVEATTLVSAPLIFFHRHHRSLEATWKYLLICSVGIAMALLGNFFLAASLPAGTSQAAMTVEGLTARAGELNPAWLQAAFLLMLVGYGTKMGLAPMHTWLPDAHSEAPSAVSALLSGALLNCALLAILRMHSVCQAAGLGSFSGDLLILLGLVSMGVAAVFIISQADFKRMLAYSSVEHMGILAFGVGLGGAAGFGALLHAVNHSLTKAALFFVAGNVLAVYRTKSTQHVRGVLRVMPVSGALWVAGFLAITGSPPFGMFISELKILQGAMLRGGAGLAAAYLAILAVIFIGMADRVLRMSHGLPADDLPGGAAPRRESMSAVLPPAVLAIAVLVLGLWVPAGLSDVIEQALRQMGMQP